MKVPHKIGWFYSLLGILSVPVMMYFYLSFFIHAPERSNIQNGAITVPYNWDSEIIPLDGKWIALPGIRKYEDFLDHYDETFLIDIPSTDSTFAGEENRRAVTIFMHVELESPYTDFETLSIHTQKIWTAHKIFINGYPINELGKVSVNPDLHQPKVKPMVSTFPFTKSFDIVIQISNHTYTRQGMIGPPLLGKSTSILNYLYKNKFYDIFFALIVFLFLAVNIGIFVSYPSEKSSLVFAGMLFVFLIMIPFTSAGDRFIWDIFPNLSYHIVTRVEAFTLYLLAPLYIVFLRLNFPDELKLKYLKVYLSVKAVLFLISFLYPPAFHELIEAIVFFDLLVSFLLYYVLIKAILNKRPQSKLIFVGIFTISLAFLFDTLHEFGLLETSKFSLAGYIVMFGTYSYALIRRARDTYLDNERLAKNLLLANERLEIRVEERTGALREAVENTREANRLKDRFISIVSHDIRSPLSGLTSLVTLLIADEDMGKDDRISNLKRIKTTLTNLIRMTGEVLSYSKNQNNKIIPQFEKVFLNQLLELALEKLQSLIDEKNIRVELVGKKEIQVLVDPNLMGIALANFLSNAIKFSSTGGLIQIEFIESNQFVSLIIKDNGVGMPSEKIDHLFSYEDNKSSLGTKGERGSGFGLPFSKEILDSLQIQVEVFSKLYEGTEIKLHFFKSEKIVLVLDDNSVFRIMIRNVLSVIATNYFIIEKEDGESALEQLDLVPVDIILSDFQMPGMNGLDFGYRVREKEQCKDTKIAIITSYSESETKTFHELEEKAKSIGIDMVIPKNLEPDELKKILSLILEK
ncbi:MAG: response regulator [Leptospira sp.]|nr:response regulator [Leptospira sp.]